MEGECDICGRKIGEGEGRFVGPWGICQSEGCKERAEEVKSFVLKELGQELLEPMKK